MTYLKGLEYLLTEHQKMLSAVRKELRSAPEGYLIVQNRNGHISFTRATVNGGNRQRKGIGRIPGLALRLAHKAYNLELESRLEKNIAEIKSAMKCTLAIDPSDIIAALPKSFSVFDEFEIVRGVTIADVKRGWPNPVRSGVAPAAPKLRIDIPPDIWAVKPYAENTKFLEHKTQISRFGVACRSKSELSIIGDYDTLALFYHYDEVLDFGGRLYSPDLIGCRADGTLIYHEHIGMRDELYRENYHEKAYYYAKAGIIPGKNLIYTYDDENGNLNMRLVRELLLDAYRLR